MDRTRIFVGDDGSSVTAPTRAERKAAERKAAEEAARDEYIRELVATAPPLTDGQIKRLRRLFQTRARGYRQTLQARSEYL